MPQYLRRHWDSDEFASYRNAFPEKYKSDPIAFEGHVRDLVSRDVKASYLKALQGLLWQAGYSSGELQAPLFPDVCPFILSTHAAGKKIVIYSSGSVEAQRLFFAHTTADPSDLTPYITAWFDTVNAGPKQESESYKNIIASFDHIAASRWLFLSDNLAEVYAALRSGMRSLPVTRPGNSPLPENDDLSALAISDFSLQSEGRLK